MVMHSVLAVFLAVISPHSADAWRVDLLEFSGASAEKLPLDPHIRNRSVAMLDVVDALLELGATSEAKRLGDRIPDWRRGMAHALRLYAYLPTDDAAGPALPP